uniref:Uncharacterized protein n=1 Tax=Euplotes crassus TaxID=5936 RepID=A0A7S3NSG4_EUPCR|mmetsp:Transcript_16002/g.15728  ORF Transcript_16002/g.15728 Transcript_16002/m.15728 type:complete len:104 (+) Transcript_16002:206-517(+)
MLKLCSRNNKLYRDSVGLRRYAEKSFEEIKENRVNKLKECNDILDQFESKMIEDQEEFQIQVFDELNGIKSSLVDERELRIESDNKLLEEVSTLVQNLMKTDD